MNKSVFTLYQYTHRDNGKRYIGVTNNLSRRVIAHAKGNSGARVFNRAVKKYGIEAFDYKMLAIFDDVSAADYHERATILKFKTLTPDGYNLRAGAPYTHYSGAASVEMRKAISVGLKDNQNGIGHHNNGLTGRKQTSEARAKRSAAQKGKPKSDEHKRKISIACMGRVSSNKGKKLSIETRAKLSAARKGREPWNKGHKSNILVQDIK